MERWKANYKDKYHDSYIKGDGTVYCFEVIDGEENLVAESLEKFF